MLLRYFQWFSWCNYSIKFDYNLHGIRHQVSPQLWCLSEKKHVSAQHDGSYLQLLNYYIQNFLQDLTCRPSRESLLFRVQILFSYSWSMNGFSDIILSALKVIYVQCLTIQSTLNTIRTIPHAVGVDTVYGCDSLTPWSIVLLEKPAVSQLVKTFLAFYGIWIFVTAYTSACQLNPVNAPRPTFCKCILVLSSHLCLRLPSVFFHSGFAAKILNMRLPGHIPLKHFFLI